MADSESDGRIARGIDYRREGESVEKRMQTRLGSLSSVSTPNLASDGNKDPIPSQRIQADQKEQIQPVSEEQKKIAVYQKPEIKERDAFKSEEMSKAIPAAEDSWLKEYVTVEDRPTQASQPPNQIANIDEGEESSSDESDEIINSWAIDCPSYKIKKRRKNQYDSSSDEELSVSDGESGIDELSNFGRVSYPRSFSEVNREVMNDEINRTPAETVVNRDELITEPRQRRVGSEECRLAFVLPGIHHLPDYYDDLEEETTVGDNPTQVSQPPNPGYKRKTKLAPMNDEVTAEITVQPFSADKDKAVVNVDEPKEVKADDSESGEVSDENEPRNKNAPGNNDGWNHDKGKMGEISMINKTVLAVSGQAKSASERNNRPSAMAIDCNRSDQKFHRTMKQPARTVKF